jgi:hypothetical protein
MPHQDARRELVPVAIAAIVAAISMLFLWSDLKNDSLGQGDGMITSTVVSRAGATVTPTEPPAYLVAPQTVLTSAIRPAGVVSVAQP